jgi:hypothetical protein
MRGPYQPQHNTEETAQGQKTTLAHVIDHTAHVNRATTTTPPHPIITTIDLDIFYTPPEASDVTSLKF